MIAEAVDYLEIVDRMPHEGTLTFHNVSWDEYEDVIVEMESHPGWRVSYNDGLLKFMSPRSLHEFIKEIVHGLVIVYAETFDTDVETYGSTAYRARKKAKGAEPDTSFYVQNAAAMRGKDHIDLEIDLPRMLLSRSIRPMNPLTSWRSMRTLAFRKSGCMTDASFKYLSSMKVVMFQAIAAMRFP